MCSYCKECVGIDFCEKKCLNQELSQIFPGYKNFLVLFQHNQQFLQDSIQIPIFLLV